MLAQYDELQTLRYDLISKKEDLKLAKILLNNPKEIAEALKKNGGYIPGVRPGAHTEETLERILNRITLSGAIFLAFIAIAPDIFMIIWNLEKYASLIHLFGGTSLLITVGVALDTLKQVESQLIMRHYDGFMDKNKKSSGRPRMVR